MAVAVGPDSPFEPIAGMTYVATTKSRQRKLVKVLKTTPQTVIYMPVGRGTSGHERSCKSSVSKFVHTHEPCPHTPFFASTVQAQAQARATATTIATPVVDSQEAPPEGDSKEAPVPAIAPAAVPSTPACRAPWPAALGGSR